MENQHEIEAESTETRPPRWRNALIAGGVVVAVILICLIGATAYTRWASRNRAAGLPSVVRVFGLSSGAAPDVAMPVPEAPREELAVMETVVVEKRVEAEIDGYASIAAGGTGVSAAVQERLIIRDGTLTMVATDPRAVHESIQEIVADMADEGAYVVSSQEHGGIEGVGPYITIRIRVPATRFDETMDRIAEMAVEVTNRYETAQDVTEEYVDLEARLESLEAARERLLGLMENARTTDELLKAEQQLTEREATIESIKGRMQYLEQAATLASITIELQPYPPSQPMSTTWRPAEAVRRSFDALVDTLRGVGDFLIFFAIAVLPWVIVAGLILYGIVRLVLSRLKARRSEEAA